METVERTITLPTDVEGAWDLLTRPEDLEGWLGAEVVLDPTPGSAGIVVDHDGTRRQLVVDEVDHGRRLSWRWWGDGDEEAASTVEITLVPSFDGTLLTVTERALAAPAASASASVPTASASAAWSHRLLHLEALLLMAAAVRG